MVKKNSKGKLSKLLNKKIKTSKKTKKSVEKSNKSKAKKILKTPIKSSDPSFIIHYFEGNGRACIARAILSSQNVDFKNHIISNEDWPDIKKSYLCEFGQLPVLQHNKKIYNQSISINIYLSKFFNISGKNIEEEYEINNLFCTYEDLFSLTGKYAFCDNKNEKNKLKKEATEKYIIYLKQIEERYKKYGKGNFYLGNNFSAADIYVTVGLGNIADSLEINNSEKYAPNLFNLCNRIKSKELKKFYENYYFKHSMF